MSQYPGKALSELIQLASGDLDIHDSFPILDANEAILADRLKRTTLSNLATFLQILEVTLLKRRVVTTTPSAIVAGDNLIAVRMPSAVSVTLNLPDGSLVVTDQHLPPKITIKDEGATASLGTPITLVPFGSQTIEGNSSISISNPRGSFSLYYVLADLDWKVIYG